MVCEFKAAITVNHKIFTGGNSLFDFFRNSSVGFVVLKRNLLLWVIKLFISNQKKL